MSSGKNSIRRRDYGAENEDLEQMQREFLSSETRPAARVVRKNKPPTVGSAPAADDAKQKPARAESDMLEFAKSMTQAIKEFQIKERAVGKVAAASEPKQDNDDQQGGSDESASDPRRNPKKLSLFAQRRLEMQRKQVTGSGVEPAEQPDPAADKRANRAAATFLPKLMAPVPEHAVVEPVCAPTMKPRETGFPQIPVDYTANEAGMAAQPNAPLDAKSPGYWNQVRREVSQGNDDKIRAMSEAEILEAQSDIRSALSDEAIERLMKRKQTRNSNDSARVANAAQSSNDNTDRIEKSATDKASAMGQTKRVQFAQTVKVANDEDIGGSSSDDDESDDELSAPPPPPPPAEWVNEGAIDVDDNSIGADSEFYTEMKRKYFPNEVVEEAKLAWIMGHKQAKSPMERALSAGRKKDAASAAAAAAADAEEVELLSKPMAHVRFAFDGHIISEEIAGEIPTTAGLHHHGDEPEKPGYTIPELLHLSRSTVPMQRAIALSALKCIIHNINVGTWDVAQSVEVYVCLLDWEAELYLAGGISGANMTQRVAATGALWTWVVEMAKYKTLVRLANGGQMEAEDDSKKPSAEIRGMLPQPAVAKGRLVERTFKALGSMLTTRFMDAVYEVVSLSMLPERHLSMLAECIKQLQCVSEDLERRIVAHGKLPLLLENKFPYLMNKQ